MKPTPIQPAMAAASKDDNWNPSGTNLGNHSKTIAAVTSNGKVAETAGSCFRMPYGISVLRARPVDACVEASRRTRDRPRRAQSKQERTALIARGCGHFPISGLELSRQARRTLRVREGRVVQLREAQVDLAEILTPSRKGRQDWAT